MGYIGQKRSERSQGAIEEGLITYSQLSAWQKRAVDCGAVVSCEWHHTGKYFTETAYYNPNEFNELDKKDFPPIKKDSIIKEKKYYVLVSAIWAGTKRYPKIVGLEAKVVDKLTDRQKYANKYSNYGGSINEFNTEKEADEFAATIK